VQVLLTGEKKSGPVLSGPDSCVLADAQGLLREITRFRRTTQDGRQKVISVA
jgi:hypothetical protein